MEFVRPIDSNSDIQPSFFDLLAKGNFESLLPSLLEPILSSKFPSNHKLIFYTGKSILDLIMMSKFGGITTEVIYGLERCRNSNQKNNLFIYFITILECHVIPFLSETTNISLPSSLKKVYKLLDLLIKISYITSDCKSFSILHFLGGIIFKHSSTDIYERKDPSAKFIKTLLIGGQLTVFLIQLGILEKVKSKSKTKASINHPITAPDIKILVPRPHQNGYPLPKKGGICPCCLENWKDPVVLSSGYIYCKKCVSTWKTCPVTKLPISNIIPLYF